ncbi:MAG: hypothetical protein OSA81_10915 [Longimicrobiales bacterium]|nr:hypothetical protein [Longimicrobiales bacterium]
MSAVALFSFGLGVGFGLLVVAAAVTLRARRRKTFRPRCLIDDSAIERIIEDGELAIEEEALDLDEIENEEDRFWSESWDEPTGDW